MEIVSHPVGWSFAQALILGSAGPNSQGCASQSLLETRQYLIRKGLAGRPRNYETVTEHDASRYYQADEVSNDRESTIQKSSPLLAPFNTASKPARRQGQRDGAQKTLPKNLQVPLTPPPMQRVRSATGNPQRSTVPAEAIKSPPLSRTLSELKAEAVQERKMREKRVEQTIMLADAFADHDTQKSTENLQVQQSLRPFSFPVSKAPVQNLSDEKEVDLEGVLRDPKYIRGLERFKEDLRKTARIADGRARRRGSFDVSLGLDEIKRGRSRSPMPKPGAGHWLEVPTEQKAQQEIRKENSPVKRHISTLPQKMPRCSYPREQLFDPERRSFHSKKRRRTVRGRGHHVTEQPSGSDATRLPQENDDKPYQLFDDMAVTARNASQIKRKLPLPLGSRLMFCPGRSCWTFNAATVSSGTKLKIPSHIAGAPVRINSKALCDTTQCEYPETIGKTSTDDFVINPHKKLDDSILDKIFSCFKKAYSVAILYDGTLLLMYDKPFNPNLERSRHPAIFGGLKVNFIHANVQPTAGPECNPAQGSKSPSSKSSKTPETKIDLGPAGERTIGCLSTIRTGNTSLLASLGLRLKCILGDDKGKHAVTVATHCILHQFQMSENENATVGDIQGLKVYACKEDDGKQEAQKAIKIGSVHKSFDDLKANGNDAYLDYDVTLLAATPGKEDMLPDLVFEYKSKHKAEMSWLEDVGDRLDLRENRKIVLLGRRIDKNDSGQSGDRISHGTVELGTRDVRKSLKPEKAVGEVERVTTIEIMGQKYDYAFANQDIRKYTRSVLWRPSLTDSFELPCLREKYASGCPLAILEDDGAAVPKYKIFGFQSSQVNVGGVLSEPDDPYKMADFAGGSLAFYVAATLPEELVRNWEILWKPEKKREELANVRKSLHGLRIPEFREPRVTVWVPDRPLKNILAVDGVATEPAMVTPQRLVLQRTTSMDSNLGRPKHVRPLQASRSIEVPSQS